jgi:hypothetical protein
MLWIIVLANLSGALLILFNARLLDGKTASEFLKPMIAFLSRKNMMITHKGPTTSITGGIYELDGNKGFTAGVAEMLLQTIPGRFIYYLQYHHHGLVANIKVLLHMTDIGWM